MTLNPAQALGNLPQGLRAELLTEFEKITRNYRERRWEAAELDGGRFCEVVFAILDAYTAGAAFPATASKPSNFALSCRNLESSTPATLPHSARVLIPRVLVGLYDVRNNRGVGHVGGDVIANSMDATFVLSTVKWVMAEMVRLFHSTDVTTATEVVEALTDRVLPVIWEVDGVKRVLNTKLSLADQTLLLLYAEPGSLLDTDLAKHLEQAKIANYRRVLEKLHPARMIEWNRQTGNVTLSPVGREYVEAHLLA